MRTLVRDELNAALSALRSKGFTLPEAIEVPLERPKRAEHGDLATNVAMLLAKPANKKPREIAEALVAELAPGFSDHTRSIVSAEIAGPGFINLRVRDRAFHAVLGDVLAKGDSFGHSSSEGAKKLGKVMVEFVSANPTGPLHLAHARGAVVGDVLVRVMRASGHDVQTEFYVNDAGQKVINMAWTVRLLAHGDGLWTEAYHGAYMSDVAREVKAARPDLVGEKQRTRPTTDAERAEREAEVRKNAKKDGRDANEKDLAEASFVPLSHDNDRELASYVVERMLGRIQATLAKLDVRFDRFFSEQSLLEAKTVQKLVSDWTASGKAVEKDGAVYFLTGEEKQEKTADGKDFERDKVLRKSSGDYTYFAADIAYHRDKLARGFTHLIDVWGADHHGQVAPMRAALEALALPKEAFEALLMQMVSLLKNGEQAKMSKTMGTFVTIDEFLGEVDRAAGSPNAGRDALRYFLLLRSSDSPMEIDIELAKKQSNDNPVFYAQMTHARICTVLERARTAPEFAAAREKGLLSVPERFDYETASRLSLPEERDLLAHCEALPALVREAAEQRAPHRVAFWVKEFAEAFASYFTRMQKVHNDAILPQKSARDVEGWVETWDWQKTRARLLWLVGVRQAYANALALLGIDAPKRMERASADAADAAEPSEA